VFLIAFIACDGRVLSFGDATFEGSTGGQALNASIGRDGRPLLAERLPRA
jgi:hypothetical protein